MVRLAVIFTFFINISCTNSTSKVNDKNALLDIYQLDSLGSLLNKDIEKVKNLKYSAGVTLKDTIFETEDGDTWKGIVFLKHNERLFFVETSWKEKSIVKRLTIVSPLIKGTNNIQIGMMFKDIKSQLSHAIPSYPDGYFGLRDKDKKGITYFFDIDTSSPLSFGKVEFSSIPDNLKIKNILIE